MLDSGSSMESMSSSSPIERKKCLKRVLQETSNLSELLDNDSMINKLDEAISEADNVTSQTSLIEKISNQQEVLMDSQMMTTSAKVLKNCTVSLTKKMRDYNYVDFTQRLTRHVAEMSEESQEPNWSLLETRVTKKFRKIADYHTILGTLQPLEKKVIVRKKPEPRQGKPAPMVVPDKVVQQAKAKDEDSVERTVRKIRKLIASHYKETRQPLDFFRLILNPHDFGRTVRNLLYISFLVKDGVVELRKDDNGNLVVQPCAKETNSQRGSTGAGRDRTSIQNVISLNVKQWTILKEAYSMEKPMIDFDEEK